MGNSNRRTCFHQTLQRFLYQTLWLSIQSGSSLVKNQNGRILQDGTGYADALALAPGELAAPVTDISMVTVFFLHDKIVCIGYFGGLNHLLHSRVLNAESNIIEECIIEQNSFLIDISYQAAQIRDTNILDTDSVYSNRPFLHIVIAWQ